MLSDLNILAKQINLDPMTLRYLGEPQIPEDRLYCPSCSEYRLMAVTVWVGTSTLFRLSRSRPKTTTNMIDTDEWGPSLLCLKCEQCDCHFTMIVYDGTEGPAAAVFPNNSGGLSTKNTPEEVKHFVDQAYKCQSVGAFGAALSMYRVALEQLLFEQGYEKGMLDKKIKDLELDVKSGEGKFWTKDLDTDLLSVIKKLGNAILHPKDVSNLKKIDEDLIVGVQESFQFLLYDIYESPIQEAKLLSSFNTMKNKTK